MQLSGLYKGVVIRFRDGNKEVRGLFDRVEDDTVVIAESGKEYTFDRSKYVLTWGLEKSIKFPGIGTLHVGNTILPGKKIATSFVPAKYTLFIDHFFAEEDGKIWVKAKNLAVEIDKNLDPELYGKTWMRCLSGG
jgi:hypothetical protein